MSPLHPSLVKQLRCAACKGELSPRADTLVCSACNNAYPVVRDVPIVIDEATSLFRIAECKATAEEPGSHTKTWQDSVRQAMDRIAPPVGHNLAGEEVLGDLADRLRKEGSEARVLILGGGSLGVGARHMAEEPRFLLAESDIAFGPRTNLIADANSIPFADGTFDAVVAQAVFEYIIDPFHVAAEIHRVLKPRGYVYAESPFMQQVHGGAYDFFRFSHLGHRRLFRMFSEERSGIVCGPGMALAWSYRYFLRSIAVGRAARSVSNFIGNLTSRWITKADDFLRNRPGAYDAASAFYFLGRREEKPIPDREILNSYRGAWRIRR